MQENLKSEKRLRAMLNLAFAEKYILETGIDPLC